MLVDIKDIVKEMINTTWPMVVISVIVIISFRVTQIIINKEKVELHKELLKLFFVIYILCLFQVVSQKDVSYGGINYIPFREMFRYMPGTYLFYKNILGNMLLFLPFGFFVSYFLNVKKAMIVVILSIIASSSIEITQLYIGRVFDVDDILLNISGALIGYFIYRIMFKFSLKIPEKLKQEWILVVAIIILVLLLVRFVVVWKNLIFIMKQIKN